MVPKKVEEIIRYYCAMSPHNEWSGILFYKIEGDFDSEEFKVICEDIYLMDIGSGGFTSYDFKSADISTYLLGHPELLDCYQGLIHSHDTMPAFFSGVDTKTLQSEGNDTIIFVSLIVNNDGNYVASITRKVTYKSQITEVGEYPFFGGITKNTPEEHSEVSHEELQYFPLEVIKEDVETPPMAQRFLEIQERKNPYVYKKSGEFEGYSSKGAKSFEGGLEDTGRPKYLSPSYGAFYEPRLPFGPYIDEEVKASAEPGKTIEELAEEASSGNIPYGEVHIKDSILKAGVLQLVTGSVFVNAEKVDLKSWCSKLDLVCHKRFKSEHFDEESRIDTFFDSWIEAIMLDIEDPELEKVGFDEDTVASLFTYDAAEMLTDVQTKLSKHSKILDVIIKKLEKYAN